MKNLKYLPNKIIDRATFEPDSDQLGGTATWGAASLKFNFSKKIINTGAIVRICDYGGNENCYRGVRGIFTFSDGSMQEQFIQFNN